MKSFLSYSLLTTLLLASVVSAYGQRGDGPPIDRKEAKALKIGIYTEVLSLTEEEAKKFWPVFNEYEEKQQALREEMGKLRRNVADNFDDLSEKELEESIDKMMDLRQKEVALEVEYYERYKDVLPIKKVALIHKAEMMYKRALISKMRERHENGGGRRK
mgnify:CR=1 FL=1